MAPHSPATPSPATSSGTSSTAEPTYHADVIVVGAGPTGLTLAAELAIAGVKVLVLERRADQLLDGSRAGGLHAHTLELLEQRGALDPFLAAGTAAQIVGFAWLPLDISDFPRDIPMGSRFRNRTSSICCWRGSVVSTFRFVGTAMSSALCSTTSSWRCICTVRT